MGKYIRPNLRCLVCDRLGVDLHHIKTRKSGGSDAPHNLMPLCRQHHNEAHNIGMERMASKGIFNIQDCFGRTKVFNYNNVKKWLLMKGWTFEEFRNKWTHPVEHGNACVICFNEECTCTPGVNRG